MSDAKFSALPSTTAQPTDVMVGLRGYSGPNTGTPMVFTPTAAASPYTPPGTGAVATTVAAKLAQVVSVFDFMTAAQQNNVILNIGSIDCAAAVQAAVVAAAGQLLLVPGGKYLINSQINVLQALQIMGVRGHSTFVLGTQNQNGFVIGDGTLPTRTAVYGTYIEGLVFNPSQTVAAFTSGSCIYRNYTAYTFVRDVTFYGSNGTANILWEGIRNFQTLEWEDYKCRFSFMLGYSINCFGSNTTTLQTNDGRIDTCEFTSSRNVAVFIGAYSNGITLNSPIAYADQFNVIQIDGVGAAKPYNIFILQPDIELDNAGISAIYCTDAVGLKQIVGGWIGLGTLAVSANAVNVTASSGGLEMIGVNCTQASVILSGPACKVTGGEVSGDNSTTPTGITINAGATDTEIVGVRVRQWITSGITFVGSPQRCLVDGVIFRNNGVDFTGQNFSGAGLQPQISGCRTDAGNTITPAASIVLHPALPFYQLSGAATTITTLSVFAQGQRVTFEALDAAGDTFGGGGNIQLKTAPTTIPQFKTMSFVCDGNANWFEDGRNF
jgi:hypothetical protein